MGDVQRRLHRLPEAAAGQSLTKLGAGARRVGSGSKRSGKRCSLLQFRQRNALSGQAAAPAHQGASVAPPALCVIEGAAWPRMRAAIPGRNSYCGMEGPRELATLNPDAPGRAGVVNLLMA